MTRTRRHATLLALCTLLVALCVGCVNPGPPDTSQAILYVYDSGSQTVLAYNDVNNLYNLGPSGAAPAADRTIGGALITSLGTLAWGGMAVNPSTNELYLVSESGYVVRVENARTQNSTTLSATTDIVSFTLGNPTTNYAGSVFSQAAIDPSSGTLYVMETGSSSQCRIWVVPNPGTVYQQFTLGTALQDTLQQDTGGAGVTVGSTGTCFGFMCGGQPITEESAPYTQYTGPRLRVSSGSSFNESDNVIAGGSDTGLWDGTTLPTYGSLAYDAVNNYVYVTRDIAAGGTPPYAVVEAFGNNQFSQGSIDQEPVGAPADVAGAFLCRVLAHARVKDWMVGADLAGTPTTGTTGVGTYNLHIWKAPSTFAKCTSQLCLFPTTVEIRGLALDGSQ